MKEYRIYDSGLCDLPDCKSRPGWRTWVGLIKRVKEQKGMYKGVKLYPPWYKFSVFSKWYVENHPRYKMNIHVLFHLDKDLFGHTMYSPSTCIFLPVEINEALQRREGVKTVKNVRKDGSMYIRYRSDNILFGEHILGTLHMDKSLAREEYIMRKKEQIERLIEKYDVCLSNDTKKRLSEYFQ